MLWTSIHQQCIWHRTALSPWLLRPCISTWELVQGPHLYARCTAMFRILLPGLKILENAYRLKGPVEFPEEPGFHHQVVLF